MKMDPCEAIRTRMEGSPSRFLGKYSLNQEVLTALYAEKIYQGQWDWVILSVGPLIMAGYLRQCTNLG